MEQIEYKSYRNELHFDLPIGYNNGTEYTREIELLKSNGVAEEVFIKKLSEKPYTWIGNVISIATGRIGSVIVGQPVREAYVKSGSVNIPTVVTRMPLADANTMLVEIHRRVWQNLIPQQEILCKYCAKKMIADVDLNKIEMSETNKELLDENAGNPFEAIQINLVDGFIPDNWLKKLKKDSEFSSLLGKSFNRIMLRIPTLGDAIRNEKIANTDNLKFWRVMAMDCMVKFDCVIDGKVIEEIPSEIFNWLRTELFNNLSADDLRIIRKEMREFLPTLPFSYSDTCPCPSQREIPYAMEASAFFSE